MSAEFAGSLRERVMLERRLGSRDAIAGATGSYGYEGAAWASVAPLAPGALSEGGALSVLPRWMVTLRKREGIDQRFRLTWRGRYLAVRSVSNDPRVPERMQLACDEIR